MLLYTISTAAQASNPELLEYRRGGNRRGLDKKTILLFFT